jgi:diguanylate cyclase (GGDEF)-like protein/PAS domain S-box-containing protein
MPVNRLLLGEPRTFEAVERTDMSKTDTAEAAEARYRGLLEAAPDAMIVVDRGGVIVTSNLRASTQFGYEPGELVGEPVITIIPDGFAERLRADYRRSPEVARTQEIGAGIELIGRRKDHSEFPLQMMLTPMDTGAGVLVTAAIRAVEEWGAADAGLVEAKERAQITLNSIGDGVGCTDLSGRITFLNVVAERLTGWSSSEAIGRPMNEIIRIVDVKTHELIPDLTNRAVRGDKTVHLPPDSVLVARDGQEFPVEDSTAPIHDGAGQATGAVIVFRDVRAARAAAEEMAYTAQHDFLTGLPNRMLLADRIKQAINAAPRHSGHVAVLYLDLDGFKAINDSLGHPVGDRLLQAVATGLVGCVRASDTVSRQGGDEFVVLLSESEPSAGASNIAERMLDAVATIDEMDGHAVDVSTSIGIAIYPSDGHDAETLLQSADIAMYSVKSNGRAGYRFYDDTMRSLASTQ